MLYSIVDLNENLLIKQAENNGQNVDLHIHLAVLCESMKEAAMNSITIKLLLVIQNKIKIK